MNFDVVWSNFLSSIKDELSSLSYDTWFSETKLLKIENEEAYIIVPMPIHKTHLNDNYKELIQENLNNIAGVRCELHFLLQEEIEEEVPKISNEEKEVVGDKELSTRQSNLIKKYTFDNFVVGNSNKFAHAAALSVAENPGKMYNPLFLYGESGLGKTHLMHAIGNYIESHTDKQILYVTSEQFIQDFIKTNRKDDVENFNYVEFFKNKYRNIDVLIIDDIQFLGGATKTQSEFFHTFNNLYNDSKQIIISSDRSSNDLKVLEDRLRTRFTWGLEVNIFPPDVELRAEIIRKKIIAENLNNEIPDDVIDYIASNTGTNVRQLEGSITRLIAYSSMMGGAEITLELAVEALKDTISSTGVGEKNEVRRIQKIVSEYFQISLEDIRSKKRSSNIAFPRQIAMYLCRAMTDESFPRIGIEFGGKDHSTVMHSVEKIETEMKVNKDLANIIEKLKKDIGTF